MKIFSNQSPPVASVVNGMRVAFLGKLGSMSRRRAKALVRHHGGFPTETIDQRCDLVVIGEENDTLRRPELPQDVLNAVEVIDESQLWQQLGLVDNEVDLSRLYTPAMLAELLRVSISTIRRWHRLGLIHPVRQIQKLPYFDFQEIASARMIARLIERGDTADSIERQLSELTGGALTGGSGGSSSSLSQLSIIVEGSKVLLREGAGLVATNGQKHFDFSSDQNQMPTDQTIRLEHEQTDRPQVEVNISDSAVVDPAGASATEPEGDDVLLSFQDAAQSLQQQTLQALSPEELIEMAIEAEDEGDDARAVEFYRAVSLSAGPTPDISFRIAELLYQSGDLSAARERYYMAVEQDETFVEARASLGCVLAELGQNDLAVATFRGALDHHPDFPDVHYHLARLLDESGKPDAGRKHWEAFLQLAPKSPWAEEARQRLIENADAQP